LLSPAQITSGQSGPFKILPNETTLTVRTADEVVTLDLPTGSRVPTSTVVSRFQALTSNVLAENVNGSLVFTDLSRVGPGAVIKVEGTAATSLGFGTDQQRGARGKEIMPGWNLTKRAGALFSRSPKFLKPIKSNPVFKVSYVTAPEFCLRCGGTRVENDFQIDSQGSYLIIENENLLYQASMKIILTDKGSNPFHTWYGTSISSRIGSKAVGNIAGALAEDVRQALTNLQNIQTQKSKWQPVTFKERLYQILQVQVYPDPQDQTAFTIDVVVQNAAREPVQLSIVYTTPGTVSRMTSNGRTLALGA